MGVLGQDFTENSVKQEMRGLHEVLFSRQSVKVAGLLFIVFLLEYGVFLSGGREWYLNRDEILDYAGCAEATGIYLCNGRWGLALYRSLFPGIAPMNGVLTAGLWICLALVLQSHLLRLHDFFTRCVYGTVTLSVTLLGEHMMFANQADAFGLAIFSSTVAVWLAIDARGMIAKVGAVALMMWSFAVYQSITLNVMVLFMGVLYLRCIRNEIFDYREYGMMMLKTLIPAVLLYAILSQVAANLPFVPNTIRHHVAEYQNTKFSMSAYATGDIMFTFRLVGHNVIKLLKLMSGIGLPLLCCTGCLAGIFTMVQAYKNSKWNKSKKLWMFVLLLVILASPFLISAIMNAPAYEAPTLRTYSAAPFACGLLWVALFPNGVRRPFVRYGIVWTLIFFVLAASYDNNNKNKGNQRYFSSLIRDYILIEYEATRSSAGCGGNPKPRVLLFGAEHTAPFDELSHHPYIKRLHTPTVEERQTYATKVRELPSWPAPGSIHCVSPDTVIVRYK